MSVVRQRMHTLDAILPLLPRQDLVLLMKRFVLGVLHQRLRAPDVILPLLPQQDLALLMNIFVLEYVGQSFTTLSPIDVVKDFFLW